MNRQAKLTGGCAAVAIAMALSTGTAAAATPGQAGTPAATSGVSTLQPTGGHGHQGQGQGQSGQGGTSTTEESSMSSFFKLIFSGGSKSSTSKTSMSTAPTQGGSMQGGTMGAQMSKMGGQGSQGGGIFGAVEKFIASIFASLSGGK